MGFAFLITPLLSLALLQQPGAPATGAAPAPAPGAEKKEAHKKSVEAGLLLGHGELKRALELAQEAVAADPESAEAHYVLGMALEAAGDLEAAESEYKKMGLQAPESLLEVSLARLYLRQGRLAEAEQQARRAVEKNRWVPQVHLTLGAVAMRKKNYAAAITAFTNAVDLNPRDWNARVSLADACRQARRWDDALTHYGQALARKPDLPEALLGKALTWEQMGRQAEAIAAYEKALETVPDLLAAQINLARLYLSVQDQALAKPARALELAKAAAEATEWKNAAVLETLADAYARNGDAVLAQEIRERAKALAPPEK